MTASAAPAVVLEAGGLRLDWRTRRVAYRGRAVALTTTQFRLLAELLAEPGRVIHYADLVRRVWDFTADDGRTGPGDLEMLKSQMKRLRARLAAAGAPYSTVRNVASVGYGLEIES